MSTTANTQFALGAYLGNPNGSDPGSEARFEALARSFASVMGTGAQFIDAYVDETKPIDQWAANASWQAWSNAQSPVARSMTPVIGLPMSSIAPGSPSADQFYKSFAAGTYDSVIQGVVKSWAAQGFATQIWRPGWEMNLTSMPSYAGNDAGTQADWVKAFQHISTVLRAAAVTNHVSLQVMWNPSITNYTNAEATKTLYPGDQYVDIIGADVYSELHPYGSLSALYDWSHSGAVLNASHPVYSSLKQFASDPVNLVHYYTDPAATQWSLDGSGGHSLSLQNLLDFAKAHGKPFAVPETGAGGTGDGAGVSDNPTFVKWLSDTLHNSGVAVKFVNIWDSNAGDNDEFTYASDNKPLEAAAWAKYFGAQSAANPPTLGWGGNSISLKISETAGPAQFTVSVDGVQIGGTQTATASHSAGQDQVFLVEGNWGSGTHNVAVNLLNYTAGRNLYVDQTTYNGTIVAGATLSLTHAGTQSVVVGTPVPPVVTLGAGADAIDLRMSEDSYAGDAQFTVKVDGVQVGGTQTAQLSHKTGQDQDFVVRGSFAPGAHSVSIDFLNDAWAGTSSTDRNLYLDGATFNGIAASNAVMKFMSSGTQSFGTGTPDVLALHVAEDAYKGNAQFTVSVDGRQIGGTYNATALHSLGQSQELDLSGNWGHGTHSVAVRFLNDAYGGTAVTDRNLYITGASYDGAVQSGASHALLSSGTQWFNIVYAAPSLHPTV